MKRQELIDEANTLSLLKRVQLVEAVMQSLKDDVRPTQPRKSLLSILSGDAPSEQEIDEARQEMWKNFPREDI